MTPDNLSVEAERARREIMAVLAQFPSDARRAIVLAAGTNIGIAYPGAVAAAPPPSSTGAEVLEAFQTVSSALERLSPDRRPRAVVAVTCLLGIEGEVSVALKRWTE